MTDSKAFNFEPDQYRSLTALAGKDGAAELVITRRHATGTSYESIVVPREDLRDLIDWATGQVRS